MKKQFSSAFSLVELTLAIGIAAFCLITVFALVPIAVLANRNASSQTVATNIMAAVIADIRGTPKGTATSAQFRINIPGNATGGASATCQRCADCWNTQTQVFYVDSTGQLATAATGRYRVAFTQVQNANATATAGAILADVSITWPAQADPCATTPSGSVDVSAAFDRN